MSQAETVIPSVERRPLPLGWRWVRLKDVLISLEAGSRPSGGAAGVTEGIPSLSAEHMTQNGGFDFSSLRFVPHEFHARMSRGHILRYDSLVVKDGATTGKVAFVGDDFPFQEAVINEHVFVCRPNIRVVEPRYMFLWLWGEEGQAAIRANYQGAAIGGINQMFADSVWLPLPPVEEQSRIARVVTEQLGVIERARSAMLERLRTAGRLSAAYLRAIFDKPEARRWVRRHLGEVSTLLRARSIATNGNVEVRAITTACLTETGFDPAGIKLARMRSDDVPDCIVRAGEVLVARSNTPELVGRAAMYPGNHGEVVASDLTIRIMPGREITPAFLSAYLSFLYLCGHWKERAGGASGSMKKITRAQIQSEPVPIPPLSEQERITAQLRQEITRVQKLRGALADELNATSGLSRAILRQAFNGEL